MTEEHHKHEHGGDRHYNSGLGAGFITGEIIMFLTSTGGLLLNLLVLYILVIRIRIARIDAILSGIITVMDLTATLSLMSRIIYKWAVFRHGYNSHSFPFCKATGTIFFASTISSFDVVSVLGLIRCLIIVFDVRFDSLYWGILLGLILAYNWIGASILTWNFTEISWGKFCTFKDGDIKYKESDVFGPVISVKALIMVVIVIIAYTLIIRFYHQYYDKMKGSSATDQSLIKEIYTQKATTSVKLLGVIFSYILVYLPKICLFIMYNFHIWEFKPILELVTSILLSMSSIVNASVILFIQDETKQEWQLLMTLLFHRVKNIY